MTSGWTKEIDLKRLPKEGVVSTLDADEAVRAGIAERLQAPALDQLHGEITVIPVKGGVDVRGRVQARLQRICVASLERFEERIDEMFSISFREDAELRREDEEFVFDEEEVEFLESETLDLAELLIQQTALAMAPFPRKPEAHALVESFGDGGAISPFAELKKRFDESRENDQN